MDIHVKNLKVLVESNPLFFIPDLKIKFGSKVLIKGASGKGKSTFLHVLAGLLCPESGSVKISDFTITKSSEQESALFRKENIGIIFQKLNLIEHMTASENVRLANANNEQVIFKALASVNMLEKKDHRTSVLSLGEQQRIAIARAISSQAKIILADEPTSSLDSKNAIQVIEILFETNRNKTIVVVSHDERIHKYFDEIIDFERYCL